MVNKFNLNNNDKQSELPIWIINKRENFKTIHSIKFNPFQSVKLQIQIK